MKLEGTIHKSIHAVDAAEWDEIVGKGRVFQTHAALAFLEEGGLADCPPKYFILRTEDGQIAAHVAAYMIETSLVIFSQGIMKAVVDKIRIVLPKFLFVRILECSCPVSLGNPLSLRKGVDFADSRQTAVRGSGPSGGGSKDSSHRVKRLLGRRLTGRFKLKSARVQSNPESSNYRTASPLEELR